MPKKNVANKRVREETGIYNGMMTRSKRRKLNEKIEEDRMLNVRVIVKKLTEADCENHGCYTKKRNRPIQNDNEANWPPKINDREKTCNRTTVSPSNGLLAQSAIAVENKKTDEQNMTIGHISTDFEVNKSQNSAEKLFLQKSFAKADRTAHTMAQSTEIDDFSSCVEQGNIKTDAGRNKGSKRSNVNSSSNHLPISPEISTEKRTKQQGLAIPSSSTEIELDKSKHSSDEPLQTATLTVAKPQFAIQEIIWAKLKGHCHWPATIKRMTETASGLDMYEIKWFNDYRHTKVYRTQMFKFLENFERFAVNLTTL